MDTPIWLLDVDGVINALDQSNTSLTVFNANANGRTFNIAYNPDVWKRVAELHNSGKVEVRWLTTWCELAPLEIAPNVGLGEFKVVGRVPFGYPAEWWKLPFARDVHAEGRRVVWTDDDISYSHEAVEWLKENMDTVLAIGPYSDTGLTMEHVDLIEKWVETGERP